jgi:hypothetical protein
MDELKKLYDVLVREGKYSKSFEEFQAKWGDQSYKDRVYDVVVRDGFYSKDKNTFLQKYSGTGIPAPATAPAQQPVQQPQETAQQPVQEPIVEKKSPSVTTALPVGASSLAAPLPPTKTKEDEEEDYFKGAFGNVLRGIDKFSPIGIGDFVDDMARSVASGYRQGTQAQEADRLLLKGTKATPEQIQKFIDANKNAQALAPSAEMQNYQKIYEKEGKGFWGVVKGLVSNPSIIPEVITSSLVGMATNTDALKAGAAAIGTGATYGAVTGAAATPEFLGAGAIPGATAGAAAAIPYAFGLASSVVEMGSTFGELLTDELKGKEMTKENVKAILEDPEKLNSIRNKAIARGAIIGTVDALTGKLASGVGAKILTKSAAKSATGAVTRGAVTRAAAAGSAVEALGGSLGEATARVAIGQDLDVSEIALEGLGELPGGIRSTIQAKFAKPSYKINGEKVTAEQVDEVINTMKPADLAKTNIEIKNDYEGREFKMRDKVITHSIKEEVKQANPDLNEPSLNAITELEKELKTLEGNKTQTGKDKASVIREKIKNIQENQLQEEVTTTATTETQPTAKPQTIDEIQDEDTKQKLNSLKKDYEFDLQYDEEKYNLAKEKFDKSNPIVRFFSKKPTFEQYTKYSKDRLELLNNNPEQFLSEEIKIYEQYKKEDGDSFKFQPFLNELKDLQTKLKEDAIQKQSTNESVLLTEQPQLGLQEVGKGNENLEETTVTTEGTQEVKDALKDVESTAKALMEYGISPFEIRDAIGIEMEKGDTKEYEEFSESYHKAKADGSNPKLVKGVEDLLVKTIKEKNSKVTPTVTPEVVNVELKPIEVTTEPTVEPTAEPTAEPTTEPTTEGETKTDYQKATEERKKAKAALKSLKEGMGISPDAKLVALVKYHKALVKEAKEFIKEKKGDIKDWAKSIGESVTKITQKAWDEATEKIDPIEKGEELDYTFEETFGEDIESLPLYDETMQDIQLEADEAYKSITYLKEVLKRAEAYHKKNNSEASKKRLDNAKAELERYEELFEKSKNDAVNDLEKSKLFKTATDIQKELLIRDVLSRFGEKQKRAPKPEELFENVVEVNKMMEHIQYLFDDANKSKVFLDEQLAKAKKEYEDYKKLNKEDRNPDREEKLKKRVEDAKKEIEEYKTKNIEEAIKYISDSDVYKNASPAERKKMIDYVNNKFLKSQKTKLSVVDLFGKIVEEKTVLMTAKELFIKQIKDLSRGGKDATKTIKEVTASIAKTLKDLQTKGELTVDQVNRILGKLAKVNMLKEESVNKFIDDITDVFEKAQEAKTAKDKEVLIKKILALVKRKAKFTASGKRRSSGLDPDGQLFIDSVTEILKAAATNNVDKMTEIMNELASKQAEIDEAVQKEMTGQPLTLAETILLNKVLAFDMFPDLLNKSVDEIQDIYDSLKDIKAESIRRLKQIRIENAAEKASMELEANDNIQEGFGILFNADGTLKSEKDLNQDKKDIYNAFKKLKIWDGVKKYLDRYDLNNKNFLSDFFRNKIANIGTISNLLDREGSLFKDNVYDKLNDMNEQKRVGIEAQTKFLDTLANKIFGTKKDGYQKLKYKLAGKGTKDIIVNGKEYTFNYGQLLRIYALSLNKVQRGKLEKMGFDQAKIDEIKGEDVLGSEFVEFADGIVEYLSTDYFDTVNDVYRNVNDVNLNQIENYFPTKSISKEANAELLQNGDFNSIFNAETSPAFKERLDTTSPIDLEPSFTDVLDNHVETMEMYKSHAKKVKEMNTFFSIPSVKTLLDQTGLGAVLRFNINNSISPNANAPIKAKGMDRIINSFTPFALAFKAMQFVKQATSIGAAYGDYSFRNGKQMFLADLPFFIADTAAIMANPIGNIRKFKNISATFKERYDSGLLGNVVSIESGGRTFLPSSQKNTLLGKFRRGFKSAAGFATFAGDMFSTFGYMANYNRNIKNGMNPEKALKIFNDYNATLQTKRPSEKSAIQHNQDFSARMVTMFGSSGLLMMNTVSQSTKNILRSINKGEAPKTRDIRKLVFAGSVGPALFTAASNIFKYMSGDDEDEDKVKEDVSESLLGFDLIFQIPALGDAFELLKTAYKGERFYESAGTNPFLQLGKKMLKIYKEEEGNIIKTLRPIAEAKLGFQFEPFMALANSTVEGEVSEDDMYDMLGVAKSYRPTGEEEQEARADKNVKEEDTTSKELESLQELINTETDADIINEAVKRIEYLRMTDDEKKQYKKERKEEVQADKAEIDALLGEYNSKDEMRRYDKALYEKTFGEGSDYYNRHEAKSKMEAKVIELKQGAEDKERGFSEPVKEKKSKRNSDGSYKRTYKRTYKRSYSRDN